MTCSATKWTDCLHVKRVFPLIRRHCLHAGFTGQKLRKQSVFRDKHLDDFRPAPHPSSIKHQKEKFLRDIMDAKGELSGLFGEEERSALTKNVEEEKLATRSREAKEYSIQALRIYRLLRPEAPVFYKEAGMLSLQSKMNEVLLSQAPVARQVDELYAKGKPIPADLVPKQFDPLQFNLPVLNPRAFLLALETATQSLADDLHDLCVALNVLDLPGQDEPQRFRKLLDKLFDSFKLRKDPTYVDEWMLDCWPRLRSFMPKQIADLPAKEIGGWLKGHLRRVIQNQSSKKLIHLHRNPKHGQEQWYDFGEDFLYDDYPLPDELVDERNTDFPLHKAGEYLKAIGQFFGQRNPDSLPVTDSAAEEFQKLVESLGKIGLKNWLNMDISEIEEFLPGGDIPLVRATDDELRTAKIMLRAAARGKGNLLDFDALDPYKLLHGFDTKSVDEELSELPENPHLTDDQIDNLFDLNAASRILATRHETPKELREFIGVHGKTPVEQLFEFERQSYKDCSPAEWEDDGESFVSWRWKRPNNAILDPTKDLYVRQQQGVDPLLKLDEMRMCHLDINQLQSMSKRGRVMYYRCVTAVGNGRGLFGTGVGFGVTANAARSDACMKAMQNLEFIDFDPSRTLSTPLYGREYSTFIKIRGRAYGRGIRCNRKYLPLMYLIGLDNCYMRWGGKQHKWVTRIRALRRCLDGMQSRKSIASATGHKYSLVVAPGDHWMHWPDRWFRFMTREYAAKYNKIKLLRSKTARRGYRSRIRELIPEEIKPEWTRYTWKAPLQRWAEARKRKRIISHNIYSTEVFKPASAGETTKSLLPAPVGVGRESLTT